MADPASENVVKALNLHLKHLQHLLVLQKPSPDITQVDGLDTLNVSEVPGVASITDEQRSQLRHCLDILSSKLGLDPKLNDIRSALVVLHHVRSCGRVKPDIYKLHEKVVTKFLDNGLLEPGDLRVCCSAVTDGLYRYSNSDEVPYAVYALVRRGLKRFCGFSDGHLYFFPL